MKLSLEVMTEGNQKGKRVPVTLSQFVIGRDPGCQLRPASSLISKRHCALLQREGKVFVRDFDSMNGTFVNDQPVKGEVEVKHQDTLKVGPIHFTLHVEAAAPARSPKTPLPPTAAKPVAPSAKLPEKPADSEAGSEDEMAALWLAVEGDAGATGEVPDGSTIMEMPVPPEVMTPEQAKADAAKKEADKPKDKNLGNTSAAARELLDKFMKRPRK